MSECASLESAVVLVVDDEPSVLLLVTRALAHFGMTIHQAHTGHTAQRLAMGLARLDLLVTDVILPDVAGPELAKALKAWHPQMQVLAMSGYMSEDVGPLTGGSFLKKPFKVPELIDGVRRALNAAA